MNDVRCVVCPHGASLHVMAANARDFNRRGDYCTACGRFCNERRRP